MSILDGCCSFVKTCFKFRSWSDILFILFLLYFIDYWIGGGTMLHGSMAKSYVILVELYPYV